MKKIKFPAAILLMLIAFQTGFAQSIAAPKLKDKLADKLNMTGISNLNSGVLLSTDAADFRNELSDKIAADVKNGKLTMNNISNNIKPVEKKQKSPFLAALMSAVVPGSGEFYGGNLLKAIIFLGVEAAGWGTYAYLRHQGDKKTDAFQAYAEQYWDIHTYAHWLRDQAFPNSGGFDPDDPDWNHLRQTLQACEQTNFSHTLPERYSQQFYELIGKYQNFQAGWTNLSNTPTRGPGPYNYETYHDPVFINYAFDRQKANDYYDYAGTSTWFIVLNHLLSAADAAWTVSKFNKTIKVETGMRLNRVFSPFTMEYETRPTLNMSVTF